MGCGRLQKSIWSLDFPSHINDRPQRSCAATHRLIRAMFFILRDEDEMLAAWLQRIFPQIKALAGFTLAMGNGNNNFAQKMKALLMKSWQTGSETF